MEVWVWLPVPRELGTECISSGFCRYKLLVLKLWCLSVTVTVKVRCSFHYKKFNSKKQHFWVLSVLCFPAAFRRAQALLTYPAVQVLMPEMYSFFLLMWRSSFSSFYMVHGRYLVLYDLWARDRGRSSGISLVKQEGCLKTEICWNLNELCSS